MSAHTTIPPLPIEPQPYKADESSAGTAYFHRQWLYRFANGYGASVVQGSHTYGGEAGLYELAVLRFDGDSDSFELTYDTPVTHDVLGYLSLQDVANALAEVAALTEWSAQ